MGGAGVPVNPDDFAGLRRPASVLALHQLGTLERHLALAEEAWRQPQSRGLVTPEADRSRVTLTVAGHEAAELRRCVLIALRLIREELGTPPAPRR